ncbi:MAG: hypothetical protein QX197_05560 [Methylococcaceae bacterium]
MSTNEQSLTVNLTDQEAWDLALFLKRIGFSEFRNHAADKNEAYCMLRAAEKVRSSLAEIGYQPR